MQLNIENAINYVYKTFESSFDRLVSAELAIEDGIEIAKVFVAFEDTISCADVWLDTNGDLYGEL